MNEGTNYFILSLYIRSEIKIVMNSIAYEL